VSLRWGYGAVEAPVGASRENGKKIKRKETKEEEFSRGRKKKVQSGGKQPLLRNCVASKEPQQDTFTPRRRLKK
jgi:hypothetical protein